MPVAQLRLKALDATSPAIAPPNDCGLNEQALPMAWCAQPPVLHRSFSRTSCGFRLRIDCLPGIVTRKLRSDLRIGRNPAFASRKRLGWSAIVRGVRHLTEREVLGKPLRGEALGGARKQGAKGAAGRLGPHRASGEVGGGCPPAPAPPRGARGTFRVNGYPIELEALPRQCHDAAGYLDALAPLAGSGEHLNFAICRRGRRVRVFVEKVALKA